MLQRVVLWRKLKQGKGQEGAGAVVIRWPGRASRRRVRPEDEGAGAAGSGQQDSQHPGQRLPPTSEETHGGQSGGRWTGWITRGPGPRPEVRLSREDSERRLQPEQPHLGCLADSRLLPRGQSRESGKEDTGPAGWTSFGLGRRPPLNSHHGDGQWRSWGWRQLSLQGPLSKHCPAHFK